MSGREQVAPDFVSPLPETGDRKRAGSEPIKPVIPRTSPTTSARGRAVASPAATAHRCAADAAAAAPRSTSTARRSPARPWAATPARAAPRASATAASARSPRQTCCSGPRHCAAPRTVHRAPRELHPRAKAAWQWGTLTRRGEHRSWRRAWLWMRRRTRERTRPRARPWGTRRT